MMNRYYISFRGLKPVDFAVILSANLLIGSYIWKTYINEVNAAKTVPKINDKPVETDAVKK